MAFLRAVSGTKKKKYIYKDGDLAVAFGNYAYKYNNQGSYWTTKTGSLTNSSNKLRFSVTQSSLGQQNVTSFISDPIDLTNVNSISVNVTGNSSFSSSSAVRLIVTNSATNNYPILTFSEGTTIGLHSVNVSSLTGFYRFCVNIESYSSAQVTAYVDINEILLNT